MLYTVTVDVRVDALYGDADANDAIRALTDQLAAKFSPSVTSVDGDTVHVAGYINADRDDIALADATTRAYAALTAADVDGRVDVDVLI